MAPRGLVDRESLQRMYVLGGVLVVAERLTPLALLFLNDGCERGGNTEETLSWCNEVYSYLHVRPASLPCREIFVTLLFPLALAILPEQVVLL